MREEPATCDEKLQDVHRVATEAAWWRARVLKVMGQARRLGATDEQLADASGLSIEAVQALLGQRRTRHPADRRPR